MNKNRRRFAVVAGSSIAVAAGATLGGIAVAQEEESAPVLESIVVTGSRIARRDFEANSPLLTVDRDTFENRSNFGLESALNQLPQFTPAGSEALSSSAGTAFPGPQLAPGAATLNLRGLGPNRSLVLVNGRRAQPINAQLIVDINSIPAAAISNVEVITGGAAAVYGADAIAGVVNFMLRDDFEGFEFDVQYGIAEVGDAQTIQASGLVGGNFADGRGNGMLGLVWSDRDKAYQRNRSFYTSAWRDPNSAGGGGGAPLPVANLAGLNYGVNPDGSLFLTNNVTNPDMPYTGPLNNLAGGAGFKINPPAPATGNHTLGYNDPDNLVSIPLTRYSLFGSAKYDITERASVFADVTFTETQATALSFAAPAGNIWALQVPYDSANDDPLSPTFGDDPSNWYPVPAELASLLNARPNPDSPWQLSRGLNFLDRLRVDTTSNIYQLTVGMRGDWGFRDWTWDVHGSHGSTSVVAQQPVGAISHRNLQQILSGTTANGARSLTIDGPWSSGWSSGATFNPSHCTSGIPIFNADGSVPTPPPGSAEGVQVSSDCASYATLELNNVTRVEQNTVEANMQGALVDNWAGEVRFALGATYRDASLSFQPDTGNSGQQPDTNVINQIALPNSTSGSINVSEIYGELLVPLVSDVPFVQRFELELGARYSEYDTAGGTDTFKILGNWAVNDWLRFRGGYQRANRAPNIYELYAPIAGALASSSDPCVNVDGFTQPFGNTESNPNLVNLQVACNELIVRDGGFDYVTLADDPTAVAQNPALYPDLDQTRMSNHRWILGYNGAFPFSIGLEEGNPDLDSERAETITIGMVLNSPWNHPLLERFTMAVDYYSIDLRGTISTPSGITIYTQCLSPEYNPLIASPAGSLTGAEILAGNPYCDLVNRYPFDQNGVLGAPGSGTDRTFNARYLNQGGTKTSGIDVNFNWGADLADLGIDRVPGAINFNAVVNFVRKYSEAQFPGAPYVDFKGTSENLTFDYRVSGTLSYLFNGNTIGLRGRYLPSIDASPFASPNTQGASSHHEFDLFANYALSDRYRIRAGVDNLFNAKPEIFGATPNDANRGQTLQIYDLLGRRYFLGLNIRM